VQAQVQAVRGASAIRNAPMKLDAGPVAGPPPAAAAQQVPIVQFIARQGITSAGAGLASTFTAEQLMLLATLTDNYREHSAAIGDVPSAQFGEGVLAILATLASAMPVGPTALTAPAGAQDPR
jgi:hypothetical protein